jgi:hypothetical protein
MCRVFEKLSICRDNIKGQRKNMNNKKLYRCVCELGKYEKR